MSGRIHSLPFVVLYQPSASRTTSIWFGADPNPELSGLGYYRSSSAARTCRTNPRRVQRFDVANRNYDLSLNLPGRNVPSVLYYDHTGDLALFVLHEFDLHIDAPGKVFGV